MSQQHRFQQLWDTIDGHATMPQLTFECWEEDSQTIALVWPKLAVNWWVPLAHFDMGGRCHCTTRVMLHHFHTSKGTKQLLYKMGGHTTRPQLTVECSKEGPQIWLERKRLSIDGYLWHLLPCWIGGTVTWEFLLHSFHSSTKTAAMGPIGWPCYHLNSPCWLIGRGPCLIHFGFEPKRLSFDVYPWCILTSAGGYKAPYKCCHQSVMSSTSLQELSKTMYDHATTSTLFWVIRRGWWY